MAVEGVHSQIPREPKIQPVLEQPEVVEALRHGNIYDVLRTPGVNRRDIEEYLAGQWRLFQNQIIQDYQVYAESGSLPPPDLENHFPPHQSKMSLLLEDHRHFKEEMNRLKGFKPEIETTPHRQVRFKAQTAKASSDPQGPGQDVAAIGEKALMEWDEFFTELQMKVIDTQMYQELEAKRGELNREVQRIISLVMSGQIDPEFVLIAAAKSNMLQNGTLFSWKGKRVKALNDEMNSIAKDLYQMDPNSQGYMKELQMGQSKTRGFSTQMQQEMMDLQKFSQNVATTLEWVNNAIRMFSQMRQTPTRAIAASR